MASRLLSKQRSANFGWTSDCRPGDCVVAPGSALSVNQATLTLIHRVTPVAFGLRSVVTGGRPGSSKDLELRCSVTRGTDTS